MVLREWSSELTHEETKTTKAPVWIKLPGLNIQLWGKKGLSKIASALGTPLNTDGLTANRILVELDITAPIKQQMRCKLPDGSYYNQQLIYEWMLAKCEKCSLWGHKEENCPKDKPVNSDVVQPNIEPLQRGLLPATCLKDGEPKNSMPAAVEISSPVSAGEQISSVVPGQMQGFLRSNEKRRRTIQVRRMLMSKLVNLMQRELPLQLLVQRMYYSSLSYL